MDDYTRRAFIRTSLPGFLGVTMALPALTARATRANAHEGRPPADGSINWDAFLEAIAREAERQHLDDWSEHAYVKRRNFHVNLLQFEPGEAIRHHDHPGMTGVLLCATGALATENYTLLRRRKRSGSFLLRQSAPVVLEKGMAASLTSKERNIHRVEARLLTQVVDIYEATIR